MTDWINVNTKKPSIAQYCLVRKAGHYAFAIWNPGFCYVINSLEEAEEWTPALLSGPFYQWRNDGSLDVQPNAIIDENGEDIMHLLGKEKE